MLEISVKQTRIENPRETWIGFCLASICIFVLLEGFSKEFSTTSSYGNGQQNDQVFGNVHLVPRKRRKMGGNLVTHIDGWWAMIIIGDAGYYNWLELMHCPPMLSLVTCQDFLPAFLSSSSLTLCHHHNVIMSPDIARLSKKIPKSKLGQHKSLCKLASFKSTPKGLFECCLLTPL